MKHVRSGFGQGLHDLCHVQNLIDFWSRKIAHTYDISANKVRSGHPESLLIEESYNYLQSRETLTVEILAITSDLFLQSRIGELARSLGKTARIVTTENELIRDALSNKPELVILDLASSDYDPFSCARRVKEMPVPPRILGMFPHVRTDLRVKGQEAGIDYIVPNSSFLKTLKTILENGAVNK